MGAALAYYSAFSLAPLLVLAIALASFVFGADTVRATVVSQLRYFMGRAAAQGIGDLVKTGVDSSAGPLAAALGIGTLVLGAITVLVELQEDLDTIWRAPPRSEIGWRAALTSRFISVLAIIGVGCLLFVSVLGATLVTMFADLIEPWLGDLGILVHAANLAIVIGVTTALFALLYKWLPNARVAWRDVWIGAAVTSVLMLIGHLGIALYLRYAAVASAYGAAGTFVVLLVWLYYSAQIFFFGAEFTAVKAGRRGTRANEVAAMKRDEASSSARPPASTNEKAAGRTSVPAASEERDG